MSVINQIRLGSVRLSELSLSRPAGISKIMAVVGYFDDSRTDGQIMSVAGLVGDETRWTYFEKLWDALLTKHGVPYFHMKEMADPKGPFKKWLPAHAYEPERKAFFSDIVTAIGDCGLKGFGATIRIKDLERFNAEKKLTLDPYAIGVYGCMLHVNKQFPGEVVSMIFDRIEKVQSRLDKADDYAQSDGYYTEVAAKIQPIPLHRALTFRDVYPIQAADFLAWEARKYNMQQNEWWEIEGRPEKWDDLFQHYQDWSRKKFGTNLPPPRKSIDALLRRLDYNGIIWDYRALSIAHNARGGVWSLSSSMIETPPF